MDLTKMLYYYLNKFKTNLNSIENTLELTIYCYKFEFNLKLLLQMPQKSHLLSRSLSLMDMKVAISVHNQQSQHSQGNIKL